MLAKRANDGMDTNVPTRPAQCRASTGRRRPIYSRVRRAARRVTPFAIDGAARYRVPPPPALRSQRYARDYEEVKRIGDIAGREHPKDRADVARFYAPTTSCRSTFLRHGRSASRNARRWLRTRAASRSSAWRSSTPWSCFDSKYFYDYWRPVTAIRLGNLDGNRRTDGDRWTHGLSAPFPSYPSGTPRSVEQRNACSNVCSARTGSAITLPARDP